MKKFILPCGIAALLLSVPAYADNKNLESGQPTSLEDAYTIERGVLEFQSFTSYERTGRNEDRFRWSNVLTGAPMENTQLRLAVVSRVDAPVGDELSGADKDGWDTTLKLLASQPIVVGTFQGALHLNAGWTHNFDEAPGERDDMYKLAAGYSQAVGEDITVILDLAREQHVIDDELENMAEIGVRQDLSENTTANIGGGFGFGDDSPDFRVTFGLARAF